MKAPDLYDELSRLENKIYELDIPERTIETLTGLMACRKLFPDDVVIKDMEEKFEITLSHLLEILSDIKEHRILLLYAPKKAKKRASDIVFIIDRAKSFIGNFDWLEDRARVILSEMVMKLRG